MHNLLRDSVSLIRFEFVLVIQSQSGIQLINGCFGWYMCNAWSSISDNDCVRELCKL